VSDKSQLISLEPFSTDVVRALADADTRCCASIYMPTMVGRDARHVPARFGNLLRDAERQMATCGLDRDAVEQRLEAIRPAGRDHNWWSAAHPAVACFIDDRDVRVYRLPESVEESVQVGTGFDLVPLAPLINPDGLFNVLTLDQNGSRLYRGSRFHLEPIALPDAPKNAQDLGYEDSEERHVRVATVGGGHTSWYTNRGYDYEHKINDHLREYFRLIDRALLRAVGPYPPPPLVLVGIPYEVAFYRESTAHPDVLSVSHEGHPESLQAQGRLHRTAWEAVAPRYDAPRLQDLSAVRDGAPGTVPGIEAVLEAARAGRIRSLLIGRGQRLYRQWDGERVDAAADAKNEEMISLAVRLTLRERGLVYAVDPDQLTSGIAATLRW
jgi:hypothetical protein